MREKSSLALGIAIMACAGVAVSLAREWPWKAALFPIAIGIPVFCLAAAEVAWVLFGSADAERGMDFQVSEDVPPRVALLRTAGAAGWMAGFFAAIALAGFTLAVPLFVFLYLKLQGRESWVFSFVFSAAVWAFFYGLFEKLLSVPFPAGWLWPG